MDKDKNRTVDLTEEEQDYLVNLINYDVSTLNRTFSLGRIRPMDYLVRLRKIADIACKIKGIEDVGGEADDKPR